VLRRPPSPTIHPIAGRPSRFRAALIRREVQVEEFSGLDVLKVLLLMASIGMFIVGVLLVGAHSARRRYADPGLPRPGLKWSAMSFVAAVILFGVWVVTLGLVIVPAGMVGVQTNFGEVQEQTLGPGLHWVTPFMSQVTNMDTRVQPHPMKEIDAASAEYQAVRITGTLTYHIDARYASQLYQEVGPDFADKIIDPALNDFVKTVTPEYSISEILNKRDEIRSRAITALGENLARYHIIIDDIYIANIAFSEEYQAAIEAKQVAAQQVQTEQQILQQKKIQADQQVAAAQGQADAQVVLAKGEAQAQIELANGQAQANTTIAQSLSDKVLQYLLIQKLGDKIQIIFMPTGQSFILDPKQLLSSTP
jgi:regulator of protease activity HflC (stomatin/prohibitin superfamily)